MTGTVHWPTLGRIPPMPAQLLSVGLCARHPHREWWTSSLPLERQAAATVCGYCPVSEACRTWSLGLPLIDNSVYGGFGARERRAARRAAQEPTRDGTEEEGMPPAA